MDAQNQIFQGVYLAKLIGQHFDMSELNGLCFELDIDKDKFPSDDKEAKIRELILWCQRSERIQDLIKLLSLQRPQIDWPQIIKSDSSFSSSKEDLWKKVIHHQLNHDVGAALSFLYKIKEIDPTDWKINSEIKRMEKEINRGWADVDGVVRWKRIKNELEKGSMELGSNNQAIVFLIVAIFVVVCAGVVLTKPEAYSAVLRFLSDLLWGK